MAKKTETQTAQQRWRAKVVTLTLKKEEAAILAALVARQIADVDARLKATDVNGMISLDLLTQAREADALIPILVKLKGGV